MGSLRRKTHTHTPAASYNYWGEREREQLECHRMIWIMIDRKRLASQHAQTGQATLLTSDSPESFCVLSSMNKLCGLIENFALNQMHHISKWCNVPMNSKYFVILFKNSLKQWIYWINHKTCPALQGQKPWSPKHLFCHRINHDVCKCNSCQFSPYWDTHRLIAPKILFLIFVKIFWETL